MRPTLRPLPFLFGARHGSLPPLKPERTAIAALQHNTVVVLVRKRAHGSGHCNSFRLCGWPLRPYSRLISRGGQRFYRIAILPARVSSICERIVRSMRPKPRLIVA
jgi:hypothetical protein